jgi:Fe2+-dicitrate sensor, membrane component
VIDQHRQQHNPDLDALLEDLAPEEADRLREVWDLTADAEPAGDAPSVDTEAALDRVLDAVEGTDADDPAPARDRTREGAPDRDPRPGAGSRERSAWRVVSWPSAAAALVLVLVGVVLTYWWQQPITRTAPQGQRMAVTLPDGSEVELNSGSTIRYERSFGDVRALHLSGEAFFEVATDERPFLVRTFNAEVRALGTKFNVRAWPDAPSTRTQVTLVEGTVDVQTQADGAQAVRMQPGETRRVEGETASLTAPLDVSVEEATAWRQGNLIAKDRPLGELLPEVERRFGVELTVRPSSLRQKRISVALRNPKTAESVVRDLSLVLGLEYRETANGFTLYE